MNYNSEIVPILKRNCSLTGCHIQGATIGNFNEYQEIKARIINGKFQLIVFELKIMPPASYYPLTDFEMHKLKEWVNEGALEN